jgi:hypothetical protein
MHKAIVLFGALFRSGCHLARDADLQFAGHVKTAAQQVGSLQRADGDAHSRLIRIDYLLQATRIDWPNDWLVQIEGIQREDATLMGYVLVRIFVRRWFIPCHFDAKLEGYGGVDLF